MTSVVPVRRSEERNLMFTEAKNLIHKLLEEGSLAFYLAIGKIGESTFGTKLLQDVDFPFGINVGRLGLPNRNQYKKPIQRQLNSDIAYQIRVYSNEKLTKNFGTALEELEAHLHRDIDGLMYTDSTSYRDVLEFRLDMEYLSLIQSEEVFME